MSSSTWWTGSTGRKTRILRVAMLEGRTRVLPSTVAAGPRRRGREPGMPLPRSVTRFTKRVANPVLGPFAARLPGFAILHHVGRRSARAYSIPVNVFLRDGHYIIGLTYGPDTDWARNVLAAGTCEITTRGKTVRLSDPAILTDASVAWAPAVARPVLRAFKIDQYMRLRV